MRHGRKNMEITKISKSIWLKIALNLFRSTTRTDFGEDLTEYHEEKEFLHSLTSILLDIPGNNTNLSISLSQSQRFSSLSSSISIGNLCEIKESWKGSLILNEEADYYRVFSVPLLRRYFLEKITSEAKLNKDYPIPNKKWTKFKQVSSILASSKTTLNT